MKRSRREFTRLALAAPVVFQLSAAPAHSVMLGAETYSFRDRPLDRCIADMKDLGLGYAELWQGHLKPANPPLQSLRAIRGQFDQAGIVLYSFYYDFRDEMSDAELENGFKIAQALGVSKMTSSANVSAAARIYPLAEKYKIMVGMHNHDSMKPNEFSTPDDFAKALQGRSKYIKITLDIGHFTASNFDPVSFLAQHHADILALHMKDRKRNHGPNLPWGQGDTNIKGILEQLKTKRYPIPALIEYEYQGRDTVVEVRRCLEYMRATLA